MHLKSQTKILPAIAAIIFNNDGQILLQKRGDVNQWGIISGHVEFGESVEEAVIREIHEETNATAAIVRFIGIYSRPLSQTYYYSNITVQYITSYFEATLLGKFDPSFSNTETKELQFFSPDNIPNNMAQIHPNWLDDALSKQHKVFMR